MLLGNSGTLILSRVSPHPPELVVPEAHPTQLLAHDFGPLALLGTDDVTLALEPRPRVSIRTWWRVRQPGRFAISTRADDVILESHELGMGNLARWAAEVGPVEDKVVVEHFAVVLPSWFPAGTHTVLIGVVEPGQTSFTTHWVAVGDVTIP